MLWKCCTQHASKFGKLSSGHRTGKGHFIPIPKKGNAKECSNYHTTALISHASKVMLKIPPSQASTRCEPWTSRCSSWFSKRQRNQRSNCKHLLDHWKKQESSRKTSTSALLITPKPLTVWITINWKILQEMGIPDHLTCLLRNLYAGQEATVRTGHGTTDWFQIGKGVHQGCILSPCLFNFYAEYIMRNAELEEAHAGIKIAGRNINNLRYADDTTFKVES